MLRCRQNSCRVSPLALYSSSTRRISADRFVSCPMPPSSAINGTRSRWVAQTLTLDTLSQRPVVEDAREQLKKTLQLIVPFFIGCLAGAAALSWLGDWASSLSVVLAGIILIMIP